MINFIKKILFWFWNSKTNPVRDKTGKVIDDIRRRRHSKKIQKKLESGELKRPGKHGKDVIYKKGEPPKCFTVETKTRIGVKRHGKVL